MPIKLRFECVIKTDWHISAGFGAGSQIDSVIERDSDARLLINGSTLKGLFRDALIELHNVMSHSSAYKIDKEDTPADRLLGAPGHESLWLFDAATLPSDQAIESAVITGVRVDPALRRAEDNKFFTKEMGQAASFRFFVTCRQTHENSIADVEWLVAAASFIRRLGSRRRRGSGRCRIRLIDPGLHDELLTSFGERHTGKKLSQNGLINQLIKPSNSFLPSNIDQQPVKRFRLLVRAERPIIVSQQAEAGNSYKSQRFIPGFTVRGAIASRVSSDKRGDEIKPDSDFARLLLLGGAKFSHLIPVDWNDKEGAFLTAFSPLGLQRIPDGNGFHPMLITEPNQQKAYKPRLHRLHDRYLGAGVGNLETHMHVAIDPVTKRARDANLYSYDTIPAGTVFVGEITLTQDTSWANLGKLIQVHRDQTFTLRLGKGRNRGYGLCTALVAPMDDDTPPTWVNVPLEHRLHWTNQDDSRRLIMTLVSDTILSDPFGRFVRQFESAWIAQVFKKNGFQIINQVSRTSQVDNFDTYSGLPRWRDLALTAGSSVVLELDDTWSMEDLHKICARIEQHGIGLRRAEGYGSVVFNHPAFTQVDEFTEFQLPDVMKPPQKVADLKETIEIWRGILDDQMIKQRSMFDKSMRELNNALSRRILQEMPANFDEAAKLLNSIGEPLPGSDKTRRYDTNYIKLIRTLMQYLAEDVPLPWDRGLVVLAEAIARGAPQKETEMKLS